MGRVSQYEIGELQRQVGNHQASISAASKTIASIDEKLERLRSAKQTVVDIQLAISDIKWSIMPKREQPDWKGQQKDDFDNLWSTFSSDYSSCQSDLDSFYDAICDEITRLENQKTEQNGIIGWCQSMINSLSNDIEKLWHSKEGY